MEIQGILFDMDGVLIDSEDVTARAACRALAEFGANCREEDFRPFRGGSPDRYFGGVSEQYGVPFRPEMKERTYALFEEIAEREDISLPGAREAVLGLAEMGLKLAICSSSDMRKLEVSVRGTGIPKSLFSAVISGADLSRNKPAPDIYLLGAERLGLEPAHCLVAEDALNGIRAGKAAGCPVAAVPTSFPEAALREAGADFVLGSVRELPALVRRLRAG